MFFFDFLVEAMISARERSEAKRKLKRKSKLDWQQATNLMSRLTASSLLAKSLATSGRVQPSWSTDI